MSNLAKTITFSTKTQNRAPLQKLCERPLGLPRWIYALPLPIPAKLFSARNQQLHMPLTRVYEHLGKRVPLHLIHNCETSPLSKYS